jgi:hypothetical protein
MKPANPITCGMCKHFDSDPQWSDRWDDKTEVDTDACECMCFELRVEDDNGR